jgi:hypothetical protein
VELLFALGVTSLAFRYAFLAYPQADDLYHAAVSRNESAIQAALSAYRYINGRWLAMFVESLADQAPELFARYPWMLAGSLALLLAGCCLFVRLILGRIPADRGFALWGALAFAVLWLTLPFGEILYWLPAAVEYLAPIVLAVALFWLLETRLLERAVWIAAPLAFLIPTLHSLIGACLMVALVLVSLLRWFARCGGLWLYLVVLTAGMLGLASVAGAPGEAARLRYSHGMAFVDALPAAAQAALHLLTPWRVLAPALLGLALLAYRQTDPPAWVEAAPVIAPLALGAAVLGIPFGMIFLTMFVQAGVPARVFDAAYTLGFGCAAACAAACGFGLRRSARMRRLLTPLRADLVLGAAFALLLAGTAFAPRLRAAIAELPVAEANRRLVLARVQELRRAHAVGVAEVELSDPLAPLTILPTWLDITPDPDDYRNYHSELYFGIRRIRLRPPV